MSSTEPSIPVGRGLSMAKASPAESTGPEGANEALARVWCRAVPTRLAFPRSGEVPRVGLGQGGAASP